MGAELSRLPGARWLSQRNRLMRFQLTPPGKVDSSSSIAPARVAPAELICRQSPLALWAGRTPIPSPDRLLSEGRDLQGPLPLDRVPSHLPERSPLIHRSLRP